VSAPAFTCPCCGAVMRQPADIEEDYCGLCHWPTGDPELGPPHMAGECPARALALGSVSELRALAVRAFTLLDTAAKADIAGVPLHPGAWHSEVEAWRERYQAYLEAQALRVPGG
jgi:hypothetical protein